MLVCCGEGGVIKISKEVFTLPLNENPEAKADIESLAREIENLTSLRDRHSGEVLDFVLKEGISDADNVLLIDSDLCVGCDTVKKHVQLLMMDTVV